MGCDCVCRSDPGGLSLRQPFPDRRQGGDQPADRSDQHQEIGGPAPEAAAVLASNLKGPCSQLLRPAAGARHLFRGRISTGMAARLAGLSRVELLFALKRFGLSPIGVEPEELADDLANA